MSEPAPDHEHAHSFAFYLNCDSHLAQRNEILSTRDLTEGEMKHFLRKVERQFPYCEKCKPVPLQDGLICFLNQMREMRLGDLAFWTWVRRTARSAEISLETVPGELGDPGVPAPDLTVEDLLAALDLADRAFAVEFKTSKSCACGLCTARRSMQFILEKAGMRPRGTPDNPQQNKEEATR